MMTRAPLALAVLALFALIAPASAQRTSSSSTSSNNSNSATSQAGKAVHEAQIKVDQAQTQLVKIRAHIRNELMAKPQWSGVVAELKKAEAAKEAAKRAALEKLNSRPDYQALAKERDEAKAQLASYTAAGSSATDSDMQKATDTVFKDGLALHKMEESALNDDPKYGEATAKAKEANDKMKALDDQVAEALKNDQDYQQATQQLTQAQQTLVQARQQMAQAAQADRQAREAAEKAKQQSNSGGGGRGR